MKIKIRNGVFETNSSSMHSIAIRGSNRYTQLYTNNDNVVSVECGEYGWGYDRLCTAYEKLCYVVTAIQYYDKDVHSIDDNFNVNIHNGIKSSKFFSWLREMVKDYIGYDLVLNKGKGYYPDGYIDHQSTDILDDFWSNDKAEFKANMKELIFNDKYSIIIDNDNH